jgi:hypothetical protein
VSGAREKMETLRGYIERLEAKLITLREALRIVTEDATQQGTHSEADPNLQVGLRGDRRHWTQRPENAAKVRAMARKARRTRTRRERGE